jgi:hypothetical protein
VSEVIFIYDVHVGHSTLAEHGWRPDPPGVSRAHRRRFLALMVHAPGSLAPAPPRGPPSTFLSVDGGRSRIFVSTRQGARCRRFLTLMVGAPGSTATATPRGPVIDVCYVDGERSRIPVNTSQGAHHRRFLALMVGAPRFLAPTPPRVHVVNVS